MLKIRHEQMEVFARASRDHFIDRAVTHLGKFWPEKCESLGDDGTRRLIRATLPRLEGASIWRRDHAIRFLDLVCEHNWDIAVTPLPPEVASILDGDVPSADKIDLV
ncbi:MAG: hypothetical protein K0U93_15510, partial [Gammaproteobacteria bacterium]|nr:hypothetical protein [Gammaproteobacteria bacterium]